MSKTFTRYFTIADFEEEEKWLRDQHKNGWKLVKMVSPCFYTFEQCEPEDVIYRLDYRNTENKDEYFKMLSDFGWEYVGECVGWFYFRKPADTVETEEDGELLSDNESKAEKVSLIITTRMVPLALIFLCCVMPNFLKVLNGEYIGTWGMIYGVFFSLMFVLYVYVIVHCGLKLKQIKKRYDN